MSRFDLIKTMMKQVKLEVAVKKVTYKKIQAHEKPMPWRNKHEKNNLIEKTLKKKLI